MFAHLNYLYISVLFFSYIFFLVRYTGIGDSLKGLSGGTNQSITTKIKVESDFEDYFVVEKVSSVRQRNTGAVIEFTLKRTEKYPQSDEKIEELYKDPDNSLKTKLILESLQSGSVKYELYDENEALLESGPLRVVKKLMEEESTVVRLKPKVKLSSIHSIRLSP